MRPRAAEHRRHDLHLGELLRLAGERVAVEHDEVGEVAGDELAAAPLVAREPGRSDASSRAAPARRVTACSGCHASRSSSVRATPAADARAAGRAPRSARPSRSRARRPSRAASGRRTARCRARPRSGRRGRGRRARGVNCTEAATPSSAKRGTSSGASSCACSIRWRRPSGCQTSRVASKASSASRFARSPIAWTATGKPARAAARMYSSNCLAARDLDAGAVEHPRGLRAERAVHERLQVADAQERRRRGPLRTSTCASSPAKSVRQRLPDAQAERRPRALEPLPEAQRAEPAVLVVHGGHAARGREPDPGAHRLDVLVVGRLDVAVAEVPARLLAQDAGRLAALVELDHAAGHLAGRRSRARARPS